jgi:carboxymethylenebutenolidase
MNGVNSGYALATRPIATAAISTGSEGLDAAEVRISRGDIELPAYYAMPKDGRKLPVVLVVHEIFGVHEHIRDVCRRLAKAGYLAVAPDLYTRQGDVSQISEVSEIMSRVVTQVPDAQVMADLDRAAAWAERTGKADANRLGITGFCWGGRITFLYAAHSPELKAGVAWYGRLTGDKRPPQPLHPIDVAAHLKAPVLGLYGAKDNGIPVATVDRMRDAAQRAGKTVEFVVYQNAGHAFFADYRPSYVEDSARDGWQRMLAWLQRYGV